MFIIPGKLSLVSKAYVKVSCYAKHSTDKKDDKFGMKLYVTTYSFVQISNSINETKIEYYEIEEIQNAESLCNCWQHCLQQAVKSFCGIVSSNPLLSSEVNNDQKDSGCLHRSVTLI